MPLYALAHSRQRPSPPAPPAELAAEAAEAEPGVRAEANADATVDEDGVVNAPIAELDEDERIVGDDLAVLQERQLRV